MERYTSTARDYSNNLTSTKDLCEFYKEKVKRMETKFATLWDLLESFSQSNKDVTGLHQRLQAVTDELSREQMTISDLQAFLLREREENLRLTAENESLRIEISEYNRAVTVLLKRAGISASQLTELLSESQETSARTSSRSSTRREIFAMRQNSCLSSETLRLEVSSLRTQLENLQTHYHNEVDVLLKDREVTARERSLEAERVNAHLTKLTHALAKAQEKAEHAVRQMLEQCEESDRDREILKAEKEILEKQILLQEYDKENVGWATSSNHKLSGRTKFLQDRLEQQEKLASTYKQQSKHLQSELAKWKDRALETERKLSHKISQLTSNLVTMKNRYEDLDRRRILEAEGFRTDIRFTRERLDEVNKNIAKLKAETTPSGDPMEDSEVVQATEHTLYTAKMFGKQVVELRKKFAEISAKLPV